MVRNDGYNTWYFINNVFKNLYLMEDKLKKYLSNKKLEDLASLRMIVSSICSDYDKNLTTYAEMNSDMSFRKMPDEVAQMHERRNKLFGLLMNINSIIEDKLFKLYE